MNAAGTAHAAELLLTGDSLSAERALAAGIVSRVVDPADLEPTVTRLVRRLAANAPLSMRAAKAAIRAAVARTPELLIAAEKDVSACAYSSDALEGRRAFLDKRAPRFAGR